MGRALIFIPIKKKPLTKKLSTLYIKNIKKKKKKVFFPIISMKF